jgi:glycosyltransferase involved in cell wall biosynthesis
MDISLVMVVKDEAQIISRCIDSIKQCCKEIIIVDTGSIDDTKNILRSMYGIECLTYFPDKKDKFNIVPARNYGLSFATCPWVLILDADETAHKDVGSTILNKVDDPNVHGYFGKWNNERNGIKFEDYKLFLFRNNANISFLGDVHAVPQTSIRLNCQYARLLDNLVFDHKQIKGKRHRHSYVEQMIQGIHESPRWYRYHWFLGYTYFQKGDIGNAITFLEQAAYSQSDFFPVEVLNSIKILYYLFKMNNSNRDKEILNLFDEFFPSVSSDFEVIINRCDVWRYGIEKSVKEPFFAC